MARWGRAMAILRQRVPEGERVLDVGCHIGLCLQKVATRYDTYGLDADPNLVRIARKRVPSAHISLGSATQLPYPDAYFASVLLLDVLEHVDDEQAVIAEITRVLRPGGVLVLSVPNAGLLRWADSHNVYAWLTGEHPEAPPGTSATEFTYHRHYSASALAHLLGARFTIEYTHFSGLGLAEFVRLPFLLLTNRLLRSSALYIALAYLYTGIYILEDTLSLNSNGYHLMIAARRVAP